MTGRPLRPTDRRGAVIAVVLVVMMILGLVVVGSVRSGGQEADLAALRVETARAFFAAESGAIVVMGLTNAGQPMPGPGHETDLGSQTIRFLQVPLGEGEAVVEGVSGLATRRITLRIE